MKKVLIGCGVVTVVVLLLLVGGGVFVTRWLQDQFPDTDVLEQRERRITERFGEPREWVAPLDGVYDPDRVATFVRLRSQLLPHGEEIARGFDAIADTTDEGPSGLRGVLSGTRQVIGLVSGSLDYLSHADSLLLAADMGKGEYAHYQILALHGVLGVDVDAMLQELGRAMDTHESYEPLHDLLEQYRDEAERLMRSHVANTLDRLRESASGDTLAWREFLRDGRDAPLPLVDPVPPGFRQALEPHLSSLEVTRPSTVGQMLREAPLVLDLETSDGGGANFRFDF